MKTKPNLSYFHFLTDEHGILQFSKINQKDYAYGYAIEDQARALILSLKLKDDNLSQKFLDLILQSIHESQGVYLLKNKSGQLLDILDGFAEASAEIYWALAEYVAYKKSPFLNKYLKYFQNNLLKSDHPRVIAYSLLASSIAKQPKAKQYAQKLIKLYHHHREEKWHWFHEVTTYANPILPWSLFAYYQFSGDKESLQVAEKTLNFLLDHLIKRNIPIVVGNKGWWSKDNKMPLYDQQPIDVAYFTLCCIEAYKSTGEKSYLEKARFYYSWFKGNNLLKVPMIRPDGGCYDALTPEGPNLNSGAESNVCYLLATVGLNSAEDTSVAKLSSSFRSSFKLRDLQLTT